jgi:hypothetical protein
MILRLGLDTADAFEALFHPKATTYLLEFATVLRSPVFGMLICASPVVTNGALYLVIAGGWLWAANRER